MRAAVQVDAQLWNVYTEGDQYVIPYVLDPAFPQHLRDSVLNAAYELENNTCLRMMPRNYRRHEQFINFMYTPRNLLTCKAIWGRHPENNVSVWLKSELGFCSRSSLTVEKT